MFSEYQQKRPKQLLKSKSKTEQTAQILEPFHQAIDEALDVNWGSLRDDTFPLANINTDKSTASQAVAFVIRASRNGVVPLCAEVASLLKDKNNLEEEISEQKEEILQLMQNQAILRSPSPPPAEMKDFSMQTIKSSESQTIMISDSSCQTENFLLVCSKKQKETLEDLPITFSCESGYLLECKCPRELSVAVQQPTTHSVGVNTSKKLPSQLGYFEYESLEERHQELENNHKNLKKFTEESESKNKDLKEELARTREEMKYLEKAINKLQENEYQRLKKLELEEAEENRSMEVNNSAIYSSSDEEKKQPSKDLKNSFVQSYIQNITTVSMKSKKKKLPSVMRQLNTRTSKIIPGPLLGCKCQICGAFFRNSSLLGYACSPYVTDSQGQNPVLKNLRKLVYAQNAKLQIHLNDLVFVKFEKIGVVRYLGHLDGIGSVNLVYAGLELQNPEGQHDGHLNGKRYFACKMKYGVFVPVDDVICVIKNKSTFPTLIKPKTNSLVLSKRREDLLTLRETPSIESKKLSCYGDSRRSTPLWSSSSFRSTSRTSFKTNSQC